MTNKKIKAPNKFIKSKQYELFDFVPEFSKYREFEDLYRVGCDFIDENLIRLEKRGKIHF